MKTRQPSPVRGPLSRPLRIREIPDAGLDLTIEASDAERPAIAAALDLPALGSLVARFRIDRRAGGRLAVTGDLDATVTQMCVVTLEPFESTFTQPIDLTFAPEVDDEHDLRGIRQRGGDKRPGHRFDPEIVAGNDDQPDPPDPILDDRIDLGATTLEFLALALDPYPKKPGVHFTDMVVGDEDEAEPSPFAALGRLKDRP